MASCYLTCRHCIYCEDNSNIATCKFHKKTINPGVARCEDVAYTPKGLARIGKKQREKLEQKPIVLKSKTKKRY